MAGLQTIINKCNALNIDRRKVVGIQITRNEVARTSETPTFQPWRMTLSMPASLPYQSNRDLIEALDTLDRNTPEIVTFGDNACLSWIFQYQGTMSTSQRAAITVQSFVGNVLTLTNLPAVASTRVLFQPNDLIQIGSKTYPFTSTTQVTRGTGTTVQIITNRPNILTGSVVGNTLTYGNACQFNMFCPNMPTYTLVPGAGTRNSAGTRSNNALLAWSDDFQLYEWVASA
jgi:hypothetical protein